MRLRGQGEALAVGGLQRKTLSVDHASLHEVAGYIEHARAARWDELRATRPPTLLGVATAFAPLLDAIHQWAHEAQRAASIDHVTLLGETGVAQIAAVWPEFAEFVSRTPAGNGRVSPLGQQLPVSAPAQ